MSSLPEHDPNQKVCALSGSCFISLRRDLIQNICERYGLFGLTHASCLKSLQLCRIMLYTRRRLRGRQPLCGIGVTSRIEVTVKPGRLQGTQSRFTARARSRDFDLQRPHAMLGCFAGAHPRPPSARHKASICASPLKPIVPAEDQEIVLPWASVMVIIVLLNVEFTWATPDDDILALAAADRGTLLCH